MPDDTLRMAALAAGLTKHERAILLALECDGYWSTGYAAERAGICPGFSARDRSRHASQLLRRLEGFSLVERAVDGLTPIIWRRTRLGEVCAAEIGRRMNGEAS